jgi:hypothetical protein
MAANKQNNPNFFSGAGITEIEYDINGNPTGTMPVRTTGETQATPAGGFFKSWFATPAGPAKNDVFSSQNVDALGNQTGPSTADDAPRKAPTSSGTGAGTSSTSAKSVGADNNPGPAGGSTKQVLAVFNTSANQNITTQPNQLDQYASYTYGISWYVLTPAQYNAMEKAQKANVAGWQLLMQSGGAPAKGRSPAFPVDYYMDDLEISSKLWGGGKNAANNAVDIRFKVTEPNGITLIQSIFNAVKTAYGSASQAQQSATTSTAASNNATTAKSPNNTSTDAPNYLLAQYCLVIQFYGYDKDGKLVAPAKGSNSGSYGQQAVITKYYPFRITDIKFQVANKAVEYLITGKPIPMAYNSSTDRGTVPHDFTMTGQTVEQLLNGQPTTATATSDTADKGARKTTPAPLTKDSVSSTALMATGADYNVTTDQGMAFNLLSG